MTDPVHIAAERLLNYFDGDADSGGDTLLHYRPYLTSLVDELRATLEMHRDHLMNRGLRHDSATCKYCAPIPRRVEWGWAPDLDDDQPSDSSVRHDAPSR